MDTPQKRIGKIVGCHGVRGDVKIRPYASDPLWVDEAGEPMTVLLRHPNGTEREMVMIPVRQQRLQVIARFEGVENRNLAEPLIGFEIYADQALLPEPEENEYWVDDLIGLTVVDVQTGRRRGVVKDLLSSGGSDFLEIQLEDGNQTVVIPFIERFFPLVRPDSGTIAVDFLRDFLGSTRPVTAEHLEQ